MAEMNSYCFCAAAAAAAAAGVERICTTLLINCNKTEPIHNCYTPSYSF